MVEVKVLFKVFESLIQKSYMHRMYTFIAMVIRTEIVHSRITKEERTQISAKIKTDGYRNESDFIRKAIQEKLRR